MPTWEDVVRIGRSLAEVEESTSYGQPALKVAGKSFANMSSSARGAAR